MPKNWKAREKKLDRRRNAMKVNSRGLLTVTQPIIAKKGKEASIKVLRRKDSDEQGS